VAALIDLIAVNSRKLGESIIDIEEDRRKQNVIRSLRKRVLEKPLKGLDYEIEIKNFDKMKNTSRSK
jgi:hypothetical protein